MLMILQGFGGEPVQSTSRHVSFQLSIPFSGVELGEPRAKRGPLFRGESLDGGFEFFDGTHGFMLPRPWEHEQISNAEMPSHH